MLDVPKGPTGNRGRQQAHEPRPDGLATPIDRAHMRLTLHGSTAGAAGGRVHRPRRGTVLRREAPAGAPRGPPARPPGQPQSPGGPSAPLKSPEGGWRWNRHGEATAGDVRLLRPGCRASHGPASGSGHGLHAQEPTRRAGAPSRGAIQMCRPPVPEDWQTTWGRRGSFNRAESSSQSSTACSMSSGETRAGFFAVEVEAEQPVRAGLIRQPDRPRRGRGSRPYLVEEGVGVLTDAPIGVALHDPHPVARRQKTRQLPRSRHGRRRAENRVCVR